MCSKNCVGVVECDYVVLKLNGSDITSLSSYEAVQMFLQSKETLVVELCRKNNPKGPSNLNDDINSSIDGVQEADVICAKTKCVQISDASATSDSSNPLPPSAKNQIILTLRTFRNAEHTEQPPTVDVEPAAVSKETQTCETFAEVNKTNKRVIVGHRDQNDDIVQTIDHLIEQEHHLFEQCLEPDIDIEEVTLVKRDSANDQIGLSVSCNGFYSNRDSEESIVKPVIYNENINTDLKAPTDDVDSCENVFISDIQPESVAGRDGRLRRGDQILRINGMDIKSKKHAETLMAENNMAVTLLVSRLLYPDDDDDDEDDDEDEDMDSNFEYANSFLSDYTNVVDKLDKVLLSQRQSINAVNNLITEPSAKSIKLPTAANGSEANIEMSKSKSQTHTTSTDKSFIDIPRMANQPKFELDGNASQEIALKQLVDKSLPNTMKSATIAKTKQYDYDDCEHIYETIPEDSETEPLYCSPYQSSNYMTAMGSCSSPMMPEADVLEMQQQTQRVAQWLGIKSQISPRSVHTLAGRPSLYHKQQQHRISNRVYTLRSAITNTSGSSSSGAGYSACGHNNVENENKSMNQEEVDNSSSAYNTGGSNNSASPRQNASNLDNETIATAANNPIIAASSYQCITQPILVQSQSSKDALLKTPVTSMLMLPFGKTGRILCSNPTQYSGPGENSTLNKTSTDEMNPFALNASAAAPAKTDSKIMRAKPNPTEEQQGQCPQFNAPNLSRYHFVSSQEVANKTISVPKPSSILVPTENASEEIPMVWKVKRRPDGTRYIVKRPVRNNVSMGIRKSIRNNEITTTEDDTISEVKIGRYWTKEERKRHIERARERRHHQQLLHQQQFPAQ